MAVVLSLVGEFVSLSSSAVGCGAQPSHRPRAPRHLQQQGDDRGVGSWAAQNRFSRLQELVWRCGLACLCVSISACSAGLFSSSTALKPGQVEIHTVATGESLSAIAERYQIPWRTLAALNKLDNPNRLEVGQRLIIARPSRTAAIGGAQGLKRVSYDNADVYRFKNGVLLWPVPSSGRIVSQFGPRFSGFHDGLDIAGPTGVPVVAAHDGEVIYSDNELSGYGNLVILRTADGLTSIYAHNKKLKVRTGQKVKRGQEIASLGSSGRSSGPHLHFEVRMRDKHGRYVAVDPRPLFESRTPQPRYRVNESLTPLLAGLVDWR